MGNGHSTIGAMPNRASIPHRPRVRWTGRSAVAAWRIRNVHERLYAGVPGARIAPLLAALGGPGDTLWPGSDWSPMILDRPLAEGVGGGHGNVRYHCSTYLPGRLIEFTFDSVHGSVVDGRHVFEAIPRRSGTLVRHTLDLECGFKDWVTLGVLVVPLHDAVLEQLLDNLERALTGTVRRPSRWSRWVRLARRSKGLSIKMR